LTADEPTGAGDENGLIFPIHVRSHFLFYREDRKVRKDLRGEKKSFDFMGDSFVT